MIYFDYAANTPVDSQVLDAFVEATRDYIANPNSSHSLGQEAKTRMDQATEKIASLLQVQPEEIIYTSGATESNNLAIKGVAYEYRKQGRHIITTYLEHSSVLGAITALQNEGFDVDFVDVNKDGHIDLDHLRELLREDTILVSICYVDSEIGLLQDITKIGTMLKSYPNCHFHVDATQAVGKVPVSFEDIDLITFSPHKFYGINGCGVLIRKEKVLLQTLIHGGISTTTFRSGTPMLAFAVSIEKALTLAYENLEDRLSYVREMNEYIQKNLSKYPKVTINSTKASVPYILNLSIKGVRSGAIQDEMDRLGVIISTKSACCHVNTPSKPVYALTKDRKAALSTLRVSLSHLTTKEEVEQFLEAFKQCYHNLVK